MKEGKKTWEEPQWMVFLLQHPHRPLPQKQQCTKRPRERPTPKVHADKEPEYHATDNSKLAFAAEPFQDASESKQHQQKTFPLMHRTIQTVQFEQREKDGACVRRPSVEADSAQKPKNREEEQRRDKEVENLKHIRSREVCPGKEPAFPFF